MRWWELVRLALGGVRRRPLRMTLTACGVAIATGAMVSMLGYGLGMHAQLDVSVEKLGILHRIEVLPRIGRDARAAKAPGDARPEPPAIPLDDAALARLAAVPGVAAAYPLFRIADVVLAHGERSTSGIALGLPPEAMGASLLEGILVAGRLFPQEGGAEAVIEAGLARDLGFETSAAALGAAIEVRDASLAPRGGAAFTFEERRVEVRVCGIFEPPTFTFGLGRDAIVLPAELVRGMPGSRFESAFHRLRAGADPSAAGYAQVVVRAARLADVEQIEREIEAMGFETRTLVAHVEELRKLFLLEKAGIFAVGTVALVVAGLGIINTLLMSVVERFREIGLYKALGASDGDVRTIFLAEAGLVGLAGSLGGLGLGLVVSWAIEAIFNRYARSLGFDDFIAAFRFPAWLLGSAVAFAVLVSLVSGVYPAHRASRVDPIQALRGE